MLDSVTGSAFLYCLLVSIHFTSWLHTYFGVFCLVARCVVSIVPLLWSIPGQCLVAQCHVCVDLCSICCQICFWDSFPLNIFVVCWLLFHVSKVNPCRCLLLMDFSHSVVSYPLERYTDGSADGHFTRLWIMRRVSGDTWKLLVRLTMALKPSTDSLTRSFNILFGCFCVTAVAD